MRLSRALTVSSMLVAFSGILALALTFEAAYWLVLPAAALVAAGGASPGILARLALPERLVTPLVIAAFGFAVADFFFIGGSLVAAGADLMLILLCLKAVSLKAGKDYVQLYAAGFFLLLASTALSTEIYFIVPFCLFFVSLTWALMLLTVRGEAQEASASPPGLVFGRGFFAGSALLTVCSFSVTLVIFFSIPRIGIGFMSKGAGGLLRISGFSDTVELGSMGEVKLDPSVVMRVRLPGFDARPDFPLYWRGRTFDLYDGRSWSDTVASGTATYRGGMGAIWLREDPPPDKLVEQEIALEPIDSATVFALNPAYSLAADFNMVRVGPGGGLFLPYPPGRRLHYTAYSAPSDGSFRPDDKPLPAYLQLPEGSEAVAVLAARITEGASGGRDKADRIIRYLGANQRYTLKPSRNFSMSPLDDFLEGSKEGFCEHFATAMALLLRSSGVHARMVSGFMGGQWNGYGGYLLVREQDAHTWVEAYIPGEGWAVFDPTPPAPPGEGEAGALGPVTRMLDYVRFRWDRYIVYYNLRDQLAAAGSISGLYSAARGVLSDAAGSLRGKATGAGLQGLLKGTGSRAAWAAAALVLAAAGLAAWRVLRGRRMSRPGAAVRFYAEMLRLLGKKGYTKPRGKTPREFARSLPAGAGRLNEGVSYVTEVYYRVRFGDGEPTKGELEEIGKVMEKLKEGK